MIKRNTWILIAVFIFVLAAAVFLQKTNLFAPALTPTGTPNLPLLGNTNDTITSVRLTDQKGLNIVAKLNNNLWSIEQPAGLQISQGSMQEILSDFNGMSVQSYLISPLPLDSTGLQLPAYTITITYQSGQNHVIQVGNLTPTQSGYYIQLDTGKTVIVNQSGIDNVIELLKTITYTPTPGLVTGTPSLQTTPLTSMTPDFTLTPTP